MYDRVPCSVHLTYPQFTCDKNILGMCNCLYLEASSPLYNEKTDTHSWPPAHCEEIIQSLDMESLLPHLLKNGLLTRGECKMINFYKEMPSKQNSYFLLNVLQRKGTDGSKRFLESLKSEKEHLGHQDLVKLLDV